MTSEKRQQKFYTDDVSLLRHKNQNSLFRYLFFLRLSTILQPFYNLFLRLSTILQPVSEEL